MARWFLESATELLHHKSPHGQEAVPIEEWLDSKTDTTLSPRYGTTIHCDSKGPPQANTPLKKTYGLMELGFYKLLYNVMFQVLWSRSS
uniref:Uncharacterized protein n=1 Tax=Timema genevievae TaxID=629358 RepID=A0A7R9JQV3_TIMGE|nr:unnamed protein product [Timema genevievae]